MILCPLETEVAGKKVSTFLLFRLATSLSEAAFHCTLTDRVMTSEKVFIIISIFSPVERLKILVVA